MRDILESDPKIAELMKKELERIRNGVELIPSENFVSKAVLQAMASVFTNKYSEGYPRKRYYGGQEFVDEMEELAIERAKKLFGCEHANVQPYSGSPANMAVFFSLLNVGDPYMGLDLNAGGHLTHGSPVNFSGRLFRVNPYTVDRKTHLLDMDAIRKQAKTVKPKMILTGLTAYPRKIDFKAFQEICDEVSAYHFSDISHIAGLCATGVHESPVPYADVVTTTTHKTLRGPRGAMIMCKKEDRYKEKYHPDSNKDLAGMIDFNVFPGIQGGPHNHVNAAKAVAFQEALQPDFRVYAKQIVKNSKALADELMSLGIKLVTDGTDNHLMIIDLTSKNLTGKGKEIQMALDQANIHTNKNTIPFEPGSPFNPSGIRLGTPAVTTRGMKEADMKVIASGIATVINHYQEKEKISKAKNSIFELCSNFPLYPGMEILK
ncbi:MAG TPA: serine hydroxymethyltransferase [Candidatus Nanoarchaeia archaeon]|nr:serine hydroxymethyltransferase [Candidatus Nanoarchaeia archaeon]